MKYFVGLLAAGGMYTLIGMISVSLWIQLAGAFVMSMYVVTKMK